jgi:hypothetical protein
MARKWMPRKSSMAVPGSAGPAPASAKELLGVLTAKSPGNISAGNEVVVSLKK